MAYATLFYFTIAGVQSGAEISGRTRVYHNPAGPG